MLTVIFIASFVLIILMISLKSIEEGKGNKLFFFKLRMRADDFVNKAIEDIKIFFAIFSKKNAKLFALFLSGLILSGLSNVKRKLGIKKLKLTDSFKNQKISNKKKGPSSFFLKNVSEYKSGYIK